MSDHSTTIQAGELLRRLAPPIRPGPAGASAAPLELFESRGFDELLSQAVNGSLPSERAVDCECDLHPPLDAEQLDRLAAAADHAEAQGSRRALMMIDGRGLEIDIASRAVISELTQESSRQLLRIDSAMVVPAAVQSTRTHGSGVAGGRGSPFAGINGLTAARMSVAADLSDARSALAPNSR